MTRLALLAALVLGAAGATAAVASSHAAVHATITPEQAREAALRAYPGATAEPARESVELETEGGRPVYEVEVVLDGREMDVLVDAETGAVLSAETDDDDGDGDDEAGEMAAADVPAAVAEALRRTHPGAADVEWDREDAGYEASFDDGADEVSVVFAADGAVVETETEIHRDVVPVPVQDALARAYPGARVTEFARIVSADGTTTYEVEIATETGAADVLFDASGRVVRAEHD